MTRLRVLAYNLEFGGRGREEAIYAVLAHLDADLIALTEADDPEVVAALARRLGLYHVWAEGSGDRHIATLSRYPIKRWQVYNKPPLSQAVLQTEHEVGSGRFSSGRFNNDYFTLYNVHFLPYLLLPFELHRYRAVGALLKLIRRQPPVPHLILGDLNAIGPGDRVLQHLNPVRMQKTMRWQLGIVFKLAVPRLLRAGYTDCFRYLYPREDGFTWYTRGHRTTRYDYILADASLITHLRRCEVIDNLEAIPEASDHFPLLAEFEWGQ